MLILIFRFNTYDALNCKDVTSNLGYASFVLRGRYSGRGRDGLVVPIVMVCGEWLVLEGRANKRHENEQTLRWRILCSNWYYLNNLSLSL